MLRSILVLPLLAATALTAQVPATPVPATAPAAPASPAPQARAAARATPMPDIAPMAMDYSLDYSSNYAMTLDNLNVNLSDLDMKLDRVDAMVDLSNMRMATAMNMSSAFDIAARGPVSWAPQDPADSLYRSARELLNRGDYRRAAELFKSVPEKFPNSVYISDAEYWQAFSLYRIGGTPELQEALKVLEDRKPTARDSMMADRAGRAQSHQIDLTRQPPVALKAAAASDRAAMNAAIAAQTRIATTTYDVSRGGFVSMMSGEGDAAGLAARIASVLSSRGMSNDPAVKRALAAGNNSCDAEDQSVKAEALNALMESDPETARQMAVKILARKDDCSTSLRRNAVMIIGNKNDDAAASTLIGVAKSDPSQGVRMAAMDWLVRIKTDAALNAVLELARSDADEQIQRAAVSALTRSDDARAKTELRNLIENNSAKESLRMAALESFDRDRTSATDGAWLRDLYAKVASTSMKDRIVSIIGQIGGDANNQWLLALMRNDNEPLEMRSAALRRAGRTMDISALGKVYDAASERPMREAVVQLLSERKEPEAVDKLIDIAKNGTDPSMRREAINALSRSKDPRASKLLLELIDR